ncbi:site-specific integrase [Streptomyces sp. MUM 203J]|uniref:tyrosine-type recombinase/integrase n=1 Tax=Streptomyces sp. MUM 203J TaxID=2791990 RepID=UPI001F03DD22|nr:site-specific integrase [Streptomyces sp. MUM 203J]MCH0538364.1 site-specific integrase [Streptomyces sp. MUM 203J]
MAYITTRKGTNGNITSYLVRWRAGGTSKGKQETESFEEKGPAEVFKQAVEAAGQNWPLGWVKGRGYITEAVRPGDQQYRFREFALKSIGNRTGTEDRYRDDCLRDLETYIFPTFANCDVRSAEHFNHDTVQAWVNLMKGTTVRRGSQDKTMAAKSIRNLHGLLSSILREAMLAEPPLRERNPCDLSSLPRNNNGADDEGDVEDIEFLEPHEVEGIVQCLSSPEDQRLARFLYGTGHRWGEATALAFRHVKASDPTRIKVSVVRAWKRNKKKGPFIGTPKSKASRRTIRISQSVYQDVKDQGMRQRGGSALIFHNGKGERLPYSTYYDHWIKAVNKAKELGLLPEYKYPTIHDLRHSHAALLISKGHPLTYVQRRLGHESIKTTSDVYGHLLPEADDDAMATIEAGLGTGAAPAAERQSGGTEPQPEAVAQEATDQRRVFVIRLGAHLEGFWKMADAEFVADCWGEDHGQAARVEVWPTAWWTRSVPGGLDRVRSGVPDRVRVWVLGPAVYAGDGTERVTSSDVHEPRGCWVWEWDEFYTEEPSVSRAEWVRGESAETEAMAWGLSKIAAQVAYDQARADALRICGLNPAARQQVGEAEPQT